MVGKLYLESMLDESDFGSATEIVGFTLYKVPEVTLASEPFRTSIFTSSEFSKQQLNGMSQLLLSFIVPWTLKY